MVSFRGVCAVIAALCATPLAAQTGDPARALTMHLGTLASDSRNVYALIGAGEAALALGDASAAVGFFGRADEIDGRNPRVKAGLGRAAVMLERPYEALRQFDKAKDLGLVETEFAADRGLAHDLRGDQKRAQRDYAIALRRGPDAETTRRMALSLGIAGDKAGAIALLDPLCLKQDRAAWRARAFVLAMTGDVAGANSVTRTVMPAMATPMQPFFMRIARLSPAQKAQAVHFGTMPSDGRNDGVAYAADGVLIPAGEPLGPRVEEQRPKPVPQLSDDPRRRPGGADVSAAVAVPMRLSATGLTELPPPTRPMPQATATLAPVIVSAVSQLPPQPAPQSVPQPAPVIVSAAGPPAAPLAGVTASSFALPASATPPPAPTPSAPARSLADIVGGLQLEEANVVDVPVPAVRRTVPQPAALKAVAEKPEKKTGKLDAGKAHPERHWAQLATGTLVAITGDYNKYAKRSAALFKGVGGYTAPWRSSHRLLTGPFDSVSEAQTFIKKVGVPGFAWTSPAGAEVEKLAVK